MNQPTVYLISKRLTPDQVEAVKATLLITPLSCVVICDPRDAALAHNFSDTVSNLKQPIALVADFDEPLTALDETGSLCPLQLPFKP
jgi:hypothetical protein